MLSNSSLAPEFPKPSVAKRMRRWVEAAWLLLYAAAAGATPLFAAWLTYTIPRDSFACDFAADFSSDTEDFEFVPDQDANKEAYTLGAHSGGALVAEVGGVDDNDVSDMTGIWRRTCETSTSGQALFSVTASLTQAANYESDEVSQIGLRVNDSTTVFATLAGDGNGGGSQTTGLQTFTAFLPVDAGSNTIDLLCSNNKKTHYDEVTTCVFDQVTSQTQQVGDSFLEADFDVDEDGFSFAGYPAAYTGGSWTPTGGVGGSGALMATAGGGWWSATDMVAEWSRTFSGSGEAILTLAGELTQSAYYEADEFSEIGVVLDDQLTVFHRITGDGNGGSPQSTGMQTFAALLDLTAGDHTLSLHCFNNKKNFYNEITTCVFDDVRIAELAPPSAPSDLQAEFLSNGRLELQWTENSSTADYRIERRSDREGDDWTHVADLPPGSGPAGWVDPEVIIDAHDPTEYEYRVTAFAGSRTSTAVRTWAPSCLDAPANPEQAWLDALRARLGDQDPDQVWSDDPGTLPPATDEISIRGWCDGAACGPDEDGHYACDFIMIGNDRFLALFIGRGLNAGGLIGLTDREYGMEFSGWQEEDGVLPNQHIWVISTGNEDDLAAPPQFYQSGFQYDELQSVHEEVIGGVPQLVFEWQLAGDCSVETDSCQTVKTFWTLRSRGMAGLHGRIEVTGKRNDGKGLLQVSFPQVTSLGYPGPSGTGVNYVVPAKGFGVRVLDHSNHAAANYLTTGLSAQFIGLERGPFALYLASEDGVSAATDLDLHAKKFNFDNSEADTVTAITFYPADGAGSYGNSVAHGEATLMPLCGDWRRIAKRYRRFALQQDWVPAPIDQRTDIPEALKKSFFWWTENNGVQGSAFYRDSANYLKQLVVVGSQNLETPLPGDFIEPPFAVAEGPPLALHLYNWHVPGFDSCQPIHIPKGRFGVDAIASMEGDGRTVAVPYINATSADLATVTCPGYLGDHTALWWPLAKKQENGEPFLFAGVHAKMAVNSETWRQTIEDLANIVFNRDPDRDPPDPRLGAAGIYLDTFGADDKPDYDPDMMGRDAGTESKGYGPWIAAKNQELGDRVKAIAAQDPRRFVTAEHYSEAFMRQVDSVFLYHGIGELHPSKSGNPKPEDSEIIGLLPAVYSDRQIVIGPYSSLLETPRAAAMRHGVGFVLGGQIGPVGRAWIGVKSNELTICDEDFEGWGLLWVDFQANNCPERLAYLTKLAKARYFRERYFRGEYLGPAEDRSPEQLITEYWCRTANCQPPKVDGVWPETDVCSEGGHPEDEQCAGRFRKAVLPAVRGGAWVSPDGDRAILLTNTDGGPRTADIPIPRSWAAAFASADLCPADRLDPVGAGACQTVPIDGETASVSLPAYSAYFLKFD